MSLGNKETMAKNIKRLMALNQVNATDICAALGFKAATFSDWVNAKTYPRIDKIEAMSNYFGVSKSDLVEENVSDQLDDVYLRFAKQAQEEGIAPDDIRLAIETIKKLRGV